MGFVHSVKRFYLRQPVDLRRRYVVASILAFVLHLGVFATVALTRPEQYGPGPVFLSDEPIVVNLQEEQQERPKSLIDVLQPSQEPPDPDTDLIAETDSKAADTVEGDDGGKAPAAPEIARFDELRMPQAPKTPLPPSPAQPESPALEPEDEEAAEAAPEAEVEPPQLAKSFTPEMMFEALAEEKALQQASAESKAAQPVPETPPAPLDEGKFRSRVESNSKSQGFLGFEAKQDDFAPYLKDIKRRVEGFWRGAMQSKFMGVKPTTAVLDCVISPRGSIESIEIVEAGNSPTYAYLCKEAIQKAGPFNPFPFEVPEIYANKNLEIRWTFSFYN